MLALALVFGPTSALHAQSSNSGTAQVQIVTSGSSGILGAEIEGISEVEDRGSHIDRRSARGDLSIIAWDHRGDASGWVVSIAVSTPDGTADIDSPAIISLTAGSVVAAPPTGHASNEPPQPYGMPQVRLTAAPALIAVPGSGAGLYLNTRQMSLSASPTAEERLTLVISISGTSP